MNQRTNHASFRSNALGEKVKAVILPALQIRWLLVLVCSFSWIVPAAETIEADIVVYGGTAGGVAAAAQGARAGKRVVLLEFGNHLGGMTSGGLGQTDIGNKAAIGGIAREFYERVGKRYGKEEAWTFEPHVAEDVFFEMVNEAKVVLFFSQRLASVQKEGARIREITMESGRSFRAKVFIDATYEGDLMARAGVSFAVGRETNGTYGESLEVPDAIGLAAYTMDSHNCQRFVKNGHAENEGDVQVGGFPPYPIAYRALVPKQSECENLLVPICLSASHIAYGSIRMEPVFMVLGHSSAVAAVMAIDQDVPVQRIDLAALQKRLLAEKQILRWVAPRPAK